MTSYTDVIEGPDPRTGVRRRGSLRFSTLERPHSSNFEDPSERSNSDE